jgi:two-component system LytT family response regulator
MKPLRVLIIDDEPPARRRLRRLVSGEPDAEVVGEAGDAASALGVAAATRPDVLLVDVQLPGPSGLEIASRLKPPRPHVIFVTAHEAHAVRAFELEALDYLLKPVTLARLREALARARRASASRLRPSLPARLPIRSHGRLELVPIDAIDWFEAADNYVVLHSGARSHVLRETMANLSKRLDPSRFVRIHRSTIVPVDRIERLTPVGRGDWTVTLTTGATLALSRTFRRRAIDQLGRWNAGSTGRHPPASI